MSRHELRSGQLFAGIGRLSRLTGINLLDNRDTPYTGRHRCNLPTALDAELHAQATQLADQYGTELLADYGWARGDYIQTLHMRMRHRYQAMHRAGMLQTDPETGLIRHRGEHK